MADLMLLNEALSLISDTSLPGALFGINFSLYILCSQLFYHQYCKATPEERRKVAFTFFYNSVMVLAVALELGADARLMQLLFSDHGGVHGEPYKFANQLQENSAIELLFIVPSFVIGVINAVVQIRRVWLVWALSPYRLVVTIFPLSCMVVVTFALDIYQRTFPSTIQDKLQYTLDTVVVSLGAAGTFLVTLLLVGRIIAVRRRHIQLIGTSSESTDKYTNIVAMLVESYALDTIWAIAIMICYALATEGYHVQMYLIFNNSGDQVTVMAFLLVTYRVLLGRAWTPETEQQLSTMRWNHNAPEDTTNFDGTMSVDYTPRALEGGTAGGNINDSHV